jgi:transcriptional regulator with GAF, ATPase, and Fis domain
MMITPELLGLIPTSALNALNKSAGNPPKIKHETRFSRRALSYAVSENVTPEAVPAKTTKHWTAEDMELALEALRSQTMNLTKASSSFGIPSTTLWQRAHRLGINTPKKDTQVRMRKITKFNALFQI